MIIVQFALWAHASHIATAAAQEGARAARVQDGSAASGQARAEDFAQRAGTQVLTHLRVVADRNRDTVRVEVKGDAVALIPGLALPVHAVSTGPVERFRSEDQL